MEKQPNQMMKMRIKNRQQQQSTHTERPTQKTQNEISRYMIINVIVVEIMC